MLTGTFRHQVGDMYVSHDNRLMVSDGQSWHDCGPFDETNHLPVRLLQVRMIQLESRLIDLEHRLNMRDVERRN